MKKLLYDNLPKNIQEELFKRHEHIKNDDNTDSIVYTEEDVLEIMSLYRKYELLKFSQWETDTYSDPHIMNSERLVNEYINSHA